jgi:hypothetical protein
MEDVSTIGLDIAKSVFQVHGTNVAGEVVNRTSLTSGVVKGSRTPADEGRRLHTRAAGVREASGEETAGRVRSVAPRTMGKVALTVVLWSAVTIESGRREALAHADERAWRRIWWPRAWLRCRRCSASIRDPRERPCRRSRIGGTGEEHSGVVLG